MAARYGLWEEMRIPNTRTLKPPDRKIPRAHTEVIPANANRSRLTDPTSGRQLRNTGAHCFRRFHVLFAAAGVACHALHHAPSI